jgi:hypothetical protein
VHEKVYDAFVARLVTGMQALRIGDPLDPATELGPLATAPIRDQLAEQVERSVAAGARILTGGTRLDRPGNYYAPTVLVDPQPGSPAWDEELFGPVAVVFRVKDLDEAIAVANHEVFGLGASAWTRPAEQERFREIEAGSAFVNGRWSDLRLPFGGIARWPRLRAGDPQFVNVKTSDRLRRISFGHKGSSRNHDSPALSEPYVVPHRRRRGSLRSEYTPADADRVCRRSRVQTRCHGIGEHARRAVSVRWRAERAAEKIAAEPDRSQAVDHRLRPERTAHRPQRRHLRASARRGRRGAAGLPRAGRDSESEQRAHAPPRARVPPERP